LSENFISLVIPAQAGIQLIKKTCGARQNQRLAASRGVVSLDSRLMELLAIRLSWQITPAKSLVMRGNDAILFLMDDPI
jgi:hypothetical protein